MKPSRTLSLFLSIVYFTTQVALGSIVEARFWQDRREKISESGRHNSYQLALIPPALAPGLVVPSQSPRLSKSLRELTAVIPSNLGTVREVFDPTSAHPPVLLLQDIHLNQEAQTNIAAILQQVVDRNQAGVIGVEGAFGPFDFSQLRAFLDSEIVRDVAQTFLKENLMAAPSYVGITSAHPISFMVGVDDETQYRANVRAVQDGMRLKEKTRAMINGKIQNLAHSKDAAFSPELRQWDALKTNYRAGKIEFGSYVLKLVRQWPLEEETHSGLSLESALGRFVSAAELESTLDFSQVDRERREIIEKLSRVLDEPSISRLLAQSQALHAGQLTYGGYYRELKNLCERHGIFLQTKPAFDRYIHYVLLADTINADQLFREVEAREGILISKLAKTKREKDLLLQDEQLALMTKLVDFSLTPSEWQKYSSLLDSKMRREAAPFEAFYQQADKRSESMVRNLLKAVRATPFPARALVLVAGGFHTPQLTALLRAQKIPYAVVSPRMTKADPASASDYLSVFAQEKTPLDKLFAGEKLFLTPESGEVGFASRATRTSTLAFKTCAAVRSVEAGETNLSGTGVQIQRSIDGIYRLTLSFMEKTVTVFACAPQLITSGFTKVRQVAGVAILSPLATMNDRIHGWRLEISNTLSLFVRQSLVNPILCLNVMPLMIVLIFVTVALNFMVFIPSIAKWIVDLFTRRYKIEKELNLLADDFDEIQSSLEEKLAAETSNGKTTFPLSIDPILVAFRGLIGKHADELNISPLSQRRLAYFVMDGDISATEILRFLVAGIVSQKTALTQAEDVSPSTAENLRNVEKLMSMHIDVKFPPVRRVPGKYMPKENGTEATAAVHAYFYDTIFLSRSILTKGDEAWVYIHEVLHANSVGFASTYYNEGMTQYLTLKLIMQIADEDDFSRAAMARFFYEHQQIPTAQGFYTPSTYFREMASIFDLMEKTGEEALVKAYFEGAFDPKQPPNYPGWTHVAVPLLLFVVSALGLMGSSAGVEVSAMCLWFLPFTSREKLRRLFHPDDLDMGVRNIVPGAIIDKDEKLIATEVANFNRHTEELRQPVLIYQVIKGSELDGEGGVWDQVRRAGEGLSDGESSLVRRVIIAPSPKIADAINARRFFHLRAVHGTSLDAINETLLSPANPFVTNDFFEEAKFQLLVPTGMEQIGRELVQSMNANDRRRLQLYFLVLETLRSIVVEVGLSNVDHLEEIARKIKVGA